MFRNNKHKKDYGNGALIVTRGTENNLAVLENINKISRILAQIHPNIYIVSCYDKNSGLKIQEYNIYKLFDFKNTFLDLLYRQLLLMYYIIELRHKYNVVYFVLGQDLLIMPILLPKILGKRVVIRSDGRPSTIVKKYYKKKSKMKMFFFQMIEEIDYSIADILMTECEYMINDNNFEKYSHSCVGNLYTDKEEFYRNIDLMVRSFDIGYIGRFHSEKGFKEFLEAIPKIIRQKRDLKIFIGGDGELKTEIDFIKYDSQYSQRISLHDWIPQNQLSNYLNNIKILVLPSYKEGLPNMILQAMACGTAVLATPVGGIPGVIQDGNTGFLMENNTPECISENVVRALTCPDLERIAEAGRRFVEDNYSFERTVDNWKTGLQDIT